jgi:predicted DNA binding protein
VILALHAQRIRERTGNLDAIHDQRITATFREQWDNIVDAVQAVFDPAAEAFTRAHQVLASKGLDHEDTDAIRRTGGEAVTAWAAALTAQEVLAQVPSILTNAAISAGFTQFANGNRAHWTIIPNLDTWTNDEPNVKDLWSVLDSGATLDLAHSISEAQQRAQLTNRERALAREARAAARGRGGFGGDTEAIPYTGADGKQRITEHNGSIRSYIEGTRTELPESLVNL